MAHPDSDHSVGADPWVCPGSGRSSAILEAPPGGLDSYLGRQFGDRDVSGGQWQRIALARAFFRNSRFLVLDEPTAALDPMAEQRLFERFATLAKGRTSIMVSHRLGPARFADRVIVMEGGRIR